MNACVIDGGLSTALEEAGHSLDDRLCTARLLIDDPEAIVTAHLAFLRAGARVLISSSYQASEAGFVAAGLEPDAAVEALRSTTALAVEARARFALEDPTGARDVLVAASVGPYGATLGDGSEYRAPTLDDLSLVDFHTERLRVLIDTEPDVLAIETISSTRETHAIVSALNALPPIRAWVTFTCRDTAATWGDDPIEEAVAAAVTCLSVMAVGVNCTAPVDGAPLLERISEVTDLPFVAYPNSGQNWRWAGHGDGRGTAVAHDGRTGRRGRRTPVRRDFLRRLRLAVARHAGGAVVIGIFAALELAFIPMYPRDVATDWITQGLSGLLSAIALVGSVGVLVERRRRRAVTVEAAA